MAEDCALLAISDGSSPTGSRQFVVALLQPFGFDRRDRLESLGWVPDSDGRSVGRGLDRFYLEKLTVYPNVVVVAADCVARFLRASYQGGM